MDLLQLTLFLNLIIAVTIVELVANMMLVLGSVSNVNISGNNISINTSFILE